MTARTTLHARFNVQGEPVPLPPECEDNLVRICQEVLANTLRHAAAAHFVCELHFTPVSIVIDFRDDGRGFDPIEAHDGHGLLGIKERIQQMNGKLILRSAPREGVHLTIRLPLGSARPQP